MTEGNEKSDEVVVPKSLVKTMVTHVESKEGRTEAKGKPAARNTHSTLGEVSVLTALQRVGQKAKEEPKERFTNLLTHVKVPLLKLAYQGLRKRAATGVDGVTWEEYGARLDEHLLDLQDRIHRGSYHPKPVRRVYIAKSDGKRRPLGIPALEDKIVQQAVRMVLEPIYEASFIGLSYGFRPGRSQHDALDALAASIQRRVNWVLDADIRAYFDTIDHAWMQQFIEHRIGDKRLVRLLMKWMKAGVMEDEQLRAVKEGTPQGGIISPLLANIYLHYVFDLWFCNWRKKHARGEVYAVRYADDLVAALQYKEDLDDLQRALTLRMAKFGLELHPEKTRAIEFGRYTKSKRERQGKGKPETFTFLGFTHIAATDRRGKFQLKRLTSRKKRTAKLAELKEKVKKSRHQRVGDQHKWLSQVLVGHYRYYGVPTNYRALASFRRAVRGLWHKWLQRRSQKGRWSTQRLEAFEARFPLPSPRIYHPWPDQRFAAR